MIRYLITVLAKIENQSWVRARLLTRGTQLALDSVLAAVSLVVAHILRFDGFPEAMEAQRMVLFIPGVVLGTIAANWMVGVYKTVWRYASIQDAARMAGSAAIVASILFALRLGLAGTEPYLTLPIGIIVIFYLVSAASMSGVRLLRRISYEATRRLRVEEADTVTRVLLAGAGDAGIMTAREAVRRRDLGMQICGFVDDDEAKLGTMIYDIPVIGKTSEIPDLVRRHRIDQVVITIASAPRRTIRRILDLCDVAGVSVRIIPGLYEILGNQVSINRIRSVQIEDLLGRDTIDIDVWLQSSKPTYADKSVMVTGGGGSIGRELCHQLIMLQPRTVLLLDKDENAVFEAENALAAVAMQHSVALVPIVCDLRSRERFADVFSRLKPQIVFHAAAHKHVPLMEANPCEAIVNNVIGTRSLLEECEKWGIERCVMVSTDKAVNPTSIMGATKRLAELMFQDLAANTGVESRYSCVRFGNVLGSRGSVVPIFRQQIQNGGPVTVTHPEATRYFMTIPEAAQLIIQAGVLGEKGEIFLLDMGEPVKVLDLAKDMVRLSGLTIGDDIEIAIIGLRAGEKIREELLIAEEGATATRFGKIFCAPPLKCDFSLLRNNVDELERAANNGDERRILEVLAQMKIGFADRAGAPEPKKKLIAAG